MLKIQHDGTIEIATGRSRRETNWKNKETRWSDLIEKLSVTHRTPETYNEYITSKKPRQDEIKDIGGFVGGYLTGGRRKTGSVMHRQLITLDIDAGQPGIWDDFTLMYDCAAAVYSTHKHSPEQPRLRLIIPIDRPVMPDEYVAIGRRIAGEMGIEMFDNTGFQPERLMYWPSTSKDGVYEFQYQDGPWLSADVVLASYRDWKDSSEWPVSERYQDNISRLIKVKQKDPKEKSGLIGAFCRVYDIPEAIECYLPDVYEQCEVPDRYTYKEGSTSGGVIIYEDKYAYSHHGTDPVSNKLCNAWDLVRIHRFGDLDENVKPDTPANKHPSFLAMADLITKDVKVKKQIGAEKITDAKNDFDGLKLEHDVEEETESSNEWLEHMDIDKKGNLLNTFKNIILILENDPLFKDKIAYDEFAQQAVFKNEKIAWREVTHVTRFLKDSDDHYIEYHLEKKYGITTNKLKKAFSVFCGRHSFHPVKEYLNSITWDRKPRLDSLLIDYMGAADSDYTRAVTRKTLTAAVARIFEPGIKFDYMLTLVGEQGKRKSTLISKLGKDWFSDSFNLKMLEKGKEGFEQVRGVWLLEIGEMVGMAKADVNHIKSFLTSRQDRYRPAYEAHVQPFPRQCVIFGTTNNVDFLRDTTGNRRFWPVDIHQCMPAKDVFKHLTDVEINQIWAEAMASYKAGETLYLSPALEVAASIIQSDHTEVDERAALIHKYLETPIPESWYTMSFSDRKDFLNGYNELLPEGTNMREHVSAVEIWTELFDGKQKDMNAHNTKFIHQILEFTPGWRRSKSKQKTANYGKQIVYSRIDTLNLSYNIGTADGTTGTADEL